MISIGIEGAVLAGKSTVAAQIENRLNQGNVPCLTVPDFAEAATERGLTLPALSPATVEQELEAIEFFLALDKLRRPPPQNGVMLLDRTCWTLAAHCSALVAVGGVDALKQVHQRISEAGLSPHHLIYLDVSHHAQLQRAQIRGHLPEPLLNAKFNFAFRQYFEEKRCQHSAIWINADSHVSDVVAKTETQISRWLGKTNG